MKFLRKRAFGLGLCLIVGNGCVSMSSLQTAETLKPGESEWVVNLGSYASEMKEKSENSELVLKANLPLIEVAYRRGWTEQLDWGLKMAIPGSTTADIKYKFFESGPFAAAVGPSIGHMEIETSAGDLKTKNTYLDFGLPLLMSYRFNEKFAAYLAPKYVHRSISGDSSGDDGLIGGAVGVKLGKEWGTYLEYSIAQSNKTDFKASQLNLALFW